MFKTPYSISTGILKKIISFFSLPFTSPVVAYRVLKALVIIVVLIASAIAFLLLSSDSTEAGWWDDNWSYRKALIIDNTGSADSNKRVKFDIDTSALISAKMQADCGDSRFTLANGQLLEYYLDSGGGACNTTSTDYWVLLPGTIAVDPIIIYHYYGNSSADNGTVGAQFSQSALGSYTTNVTASEEKSPGPVGYWNLDEGTGTTAYDSTLSRNNATWVSGGTSAVKIDDAGNPGLIPGSSRQVVRTSSGTLYAFINDGGSCEIWKSTDGSTWSEQDGNNNPLCQTNTVSAAIDGNNTIHLAYWDDASIQVQYRSFSSDTFGSEENVFSGGSDNGQLLSIAIDSSNVPHIAHQYIHTGSPETQVLYSNRVGGAWTNSGTQVELGDAITIGSLGQLTINEDNIPEIVYTHDANADLTAALGNGNNATGFTLQDIDTDIPIGDAGKQEASISIDEGGNTWVAYVDENGATDYVTLIKHNDADAWTTWQSSTNDTKAGKEPSIAIDGSSAYVFYQNSTDDIAYDVYTGSWSGETALDVGGATVYQDVHVKWSYLYNNQGSIQIDYIYSDATDIWYNKLSLGAGASPTWKSSDSCLINNCLFFDGSDDVATVNNANAIDFDTGLTAGFSISAWVRVNSDGENNVGEIVNKGTNTYIRVDSEGSDGLADLEANLDLATTDANINIADGITLNKWHHVVVTHDGTSSITVYIDGVSRGSNTGSGSKASDTNNFLIGGPSSANFHGYIDEVKVHHTARSAAQVQSDYVSRGSTHGVAAQFGDNGPDDQLSNGLIGYWNLDENTGSSTTDYSGNGNTGTLSNSPSWVNGRFGPGVSFDGTNDYIVVTDANALDLTTLTLSAWINRTGASGDGAETIIKKDKNYILRLTSGGALDAHFWTGSTHYTISSTQTVTNGSWTHIGLTVPSDPSKAQLYFNGDLANTQVATGIEATDYTSALSFGANPSADENFLGLLDDIRIYRRALDAREIRSLSEWAPGPVSYWSMDDVSSSTLIPDISGNEHTFIGGSGTLGTPTLLDNGSNGLTGTQTQTTASFSPTLGKKLLIYIFSACENHTSGFNWSISASAGDTPSVKQTSSIYAMGPSANFNTQSILYELTVSSSGSRTFTFDANSSSSSVYNYSYAVVEVDNGSYAQTVVANGANINPESSSASGTLTLGSNPTSGNLVMAFAGKYNIVAGALSTPTSYNTLINQSQRYTGVGSFYRNDTTSPTVTFSDLGQTVGAWSGFVLELAPSSTSFTWSPGKYGSSLSLDGVDFARLSDNADFDFGTGSFTIAGWVNHLTMSGGADYILTKSQIGTNGGYQVYMASDGDIVFEIDDDSAWGPDDSATTTAATYDDGAWHHIAAVKNETTGIYVYVDGVLIGSDTSIAATGTLSNDDPLDLGIGDDESSGAFAGNLDDIRIYNYARTPGQIVQDMNGGHPLGGSPVGSEVAYWGFDEGSLNTCSGGSNDFCDQTANANDLALGQTTAGYTTNGKFGLAFDGSASYWASRADDDDFDVGIIDDLTVSLWFRSDAASLPGATEYLVNKSNTTTQGYAIYTTTSGYVCFGIDDDGSWGPDIASCNSTNLYDATWHHVVGVRDHSLSDKNYLYVDGRLIDSDSDTTTATLANALSLYVKDDDGDSTNSFAGDIDELKIYRAALTSDEVLIDYSHGGAATLGSSSTESDGSTSSNAASREYCIPGDTSSCSGPVGEWELDEGTGTTSTYDTSGNGRTGSLMSITQTAWSPGKYGSSLKLDGSADYVDIGTGPTSVKTATFWVYPETTTEYFLNFTSTTDYIFLNNGIVTAIGFTSPTIYVDGMTSTYIFDANRWYYVAVTSDTAENASNFDIGRVIDALYLQGKIDQVRLYDYVRTPAQIAWDYNKGQPVTYFAFDECQGSTANNSIANGNGDPSGNNGTIFAPATGSNTSVGTCSSGNGNEMWDNGTNGKLNASLEFDDTNDYVQVADANALDLTAGLSISAWVNTDADEADNVIVSKGTSYEVGVNNVGDVYWESGGSTVDDDSAAVLTGGWHHVVITNNDTTVTYYVDGEKTGTDALGVGADNTIVLRIGSDGSNYFDGQIDEVKVWNYVLTGEQVLTDYNLGAAVRFSWDQRILSLIGSLLEKGKNIPPDVPQIAVLILISLILVKQRERIGRIGRIRRIGRMRPIGLMRLIGPIRLMRTIRLIRPIGPIVLLAAGVGVFLYLASGPTDAGWFNDNWQFRKKITVTNNTSAENNVYVTLSSYNTSDTSRYQADCGDIRFTKTNGQLLKYYVVSGCGTSSTTVHILLDTFAAGSQDIYLYYGNPTVENGFEAADFSTAATNSTVGSPASEEKGPGPSAAWGFDEGYGTTANDSTENNIDGTLGGLVPGANNTLEQQIEIINQEYSTAGTTQPTDNSLGMITWDGTKYNGESVYFEALAYCSSCTGGNTEVDVTLYTSAGSAVSASTISTTATGYTRIRTASDILGSLSNGTDYTVRITRDSTGGTAYIKAARLIVVQTAAPITDTQTQVEVGSSDSTTSTTSSSEETIGSFDSFNNAIAAYTSTAKLTDTTFVVAYSDTGNSGIGTAVIGSVSGTTISYGPESGFNPGSTIYVSVAALDSTHFVVAFRDGDTFGKAMVGQVTGTSITAYGTESAFNSAATSFISVAALDSTHFVATYQDAGNSGFGTGVVGVTNGSTTISSYGAENVFLSATTVYVSVATLDSTHFVVAYVGTSSFGTAIVGVTDGSTTISSYGAENVFNSATTGYTAVAVLDSTHFVVAYKDLGNSSFGTAIVGVTDGSTTISSYGAENVFNSGETSDAAVAVLDSTHFVAVYKDTGNSGYGTGIVGVTSGTTISSYGAENVYNSALNTYTTVAALDSTHFVLSYEDTGNSSYGTGIVGVTSGTTISSYGVELVFNSVATSQVSAASLDSTHVVIAYSDTINSGQGTVVIGSVSGTTITYGAESIFNAANTSYMSVTALDSTHFVVAYRDIGNFNQGTAIVGVTDGGTTVSSYGAENIFNAATSAYISVDMLDSTHFVVAYQDSGGSSQGGARVGVTNGATTISSYGAENLFNSVTTLYNSVSALDSTHFVVAYQDSGGAGEGGARIGLTDGGTTISSYGAENLFNAATTSQLAVSALDSTHFVVVFRDTGNSDYGTAIVGLTDGATTISSYGAENVFNAAQTFLPSTSALDSTHFIVAYSDDGNSSKGTLIKGTVSGTTITQYGNEAVFHQDYIEDSAVAALSATKYVVAASDVGSVMPFGRAAVGTTQSTITNPKYYTYDNSQYSGTKTAYLEATLKSSTYSSPTSAGPRSATASSDCTETANGDAFATVAWTSPGNAFSNNTTYATASVDGSASEWLTCTNFGFTLPATTASITGIVVEAETFSSSTNNGGSSDYQARIIKGGSIGSTDRAAAGAYGTSADVYISHGTGTTDLWGNTWSYSDINATNFGFALSVQKASGAGAAHTVSVDNVRITVYYTDNATATAYAELYNRTDAAIVTNSTISVNSTSWDLVRSSALSTNWDTSNADEYEVRIYTSIASATAYIANAKIIIDQTDSGGLTDIEVVHTYNNTAATDSDTTYTSQSFPNRLDKANFSGGSYNAYFESTLKTSNSSNAYFAQLDYNGGTGQVTASDVAFTRKRSSDIWSSLPGSATNIDIQLKNASTSTTTSSGSWLIIQASGLDIGTPSTNPDWKEGTDCIAGKCLFFDGSADGVVVNNQSPIDLNEGLASAFTIAFWMKANSLGESNVGQMFNKGASTYARLAAGSTSNVADLQVSLALASSNATLTIDDGVTLNRWHQVFIQYADDGDDEITIFIDSVQKGVSTNGSGAPADDTSRLLIGGATSANYHGSLDDFKIYPYVRTPDELKTDHVSRGSTHGVSAQFGDNGPMDHLGDGLVGYWKLDESSGNASDSSGNGTTLTDGSASTYAGAKYGNGVDFESSSSDYLSTADSALLSQTGDITLSAWIKPESVTAATEFVIAGKWDGASESYLFEQYGDEIRLRMDSSADYVTTNAANLAAGTWYHVAGVFDSAHAVASLYVNGKLEPTTTTGTIPSSITDDTGRFSVGSEDSTSGGANFYDGIVDEVRLYNRMLDPSEIQALSEWAPEAVAHWKFDEGTGTSTFDISGNQNAGILANSPRWDAGRYGEAVGFDGTNDYATVADSSSLDLANDFSVETWVAPDSLLSANSDNNYSFFDKGAYQIFFGKSDGTIRAQVGNTTTSWAQAYAGSNHGFNAPTVYKGKLYFGEDPTGDIYVCNPATAGDAQTCDNGSDFSVSYNGANDTFRSMAVYNGKLYAGQGEGNSDGDVYVCNPATAGDAQTCDNASDWTISYDGGNNKISALAVYNGKLYAGDGTGSNNGNVLAFDGTTWSTSYTGTTDRVVSLAVFNGILYAGQAGAAGDGNVIMFDGTTWSTSYDGSAAFLNALGVYNGKLYAGFGESAGNADIYVCNPVAAGNSQLCDNASDWTLSYDGSTETIYGFAVYNGRLYAAKGNSAGNGDVLSYNGSSWTTSYDGSGNGAIHMAVFKGKLYTTLHGSANGDGDIYVLDAGNEVASATSSWNATVWQHLAAVKNGTTMSLYVNGSSQGSVTLNSSTIETNSFPLLIGKGYGARSMSTGEELFGGRLDDIRIYNYARTPGQIVEDMNGGHPLGGSPVGSEVAYWGFDEGSLNTCSGGSNDFCDQTANANDLALGQTTAGYTTNGKFGLAFDGSASYWASRADDDDFDVGIIDDLTVSLWFRSDAASLPGAIEYLANKSNATTQGYALYTNTSGYVCFGIDDDATWGPDIASCNSTNLYDATWHHVVGVRDHSLSDKNYLYIDGRLIDSDSDTTTATLANSLSLYVKDDDGDSTNSFAGDIDELKIYRAALTGDEVLIDYNRGASAVLGSISTESNGTTASNAASREYCVPGDTGTCNAPVARWTMDENTGTTINDISGNSNNSSSFTGNVSWQVGKIGSGLKFDGTDDVVRVVETSSTDIGGTADSYTVSAWFKTGTDFSVNSALISKDDGSCCADGFPFRLRVDSFERASFQISDATNFPEAVWSTTVNDDKWHHAVGVRSVATDTIYLYIDGVQVASTADTTTATTVNNDDISIGNASTSYIGNDFQGLIDDVRIYNYVRTPAQIAWDYSRGAPLAHYTFDECQGATAYNSVPNGNGDPLGMNGTLYIGASGTNTSAGTCAGSAGEAWADGETGKVNSSLEFDGTDDYVWVADDSRLDVGADMSLSVWVKRGSTGTVQYILTKDRNPDPSGYGILFTGSDTIDYFYSDGSWRDAYTSATYTDTSAWMNIVVTHTAGTQKIYVNGRLAPLSLGGSNPAYPTNSGNPLRIGSYSAGGYFNGKVDDVRIYNYVLTPHQIKTLHAQGAVRFE